ncbi:MAG TPA: hypothetical protein PLH19_07515 [Anaerolineae bacterium]|nr:hypothetical protein [Anaerolineae bacterium]HQH38367.1 hypothetical protein [Anaerolineae bacterium]
MTTQTFEITEKAQITINECLGNLTVKGTEAKTVTVKISGTDDEAHLTQEGDTLVIRTLSDCQVLCPTNTVLTIDSVHGDLKVKNVHDDLTIKSVNGDASLHEVGPTTLESVAGDLRARNVNGNLAVESVAGDARLTIVSGEASIESIGSDLRAAGLAQGLTVKSAGSDVRLGPPFTAGMVYEVRAGSDLIVHLPENPNVRFELQAGGGVRSGIPDLVLHQEGGMTSGALGEGAALIKAQVGGRAVIKLVGDENNYPGDFDFDFDLDLSFLDSLNELGPLIEARVTQALAGLEAGLQEGLRSIDSDRIRIQIERAAEQAQRATERAAEQAQRAAERVTEEARRAAEHEAERARRAAEHEAERARMRAEHAERRWQRASGYPTPPEPPAPPAPPTPPTSPTPPEPSAHTADELREERLHVLRMVQEGQLTPEDAAKLLAALH